MLELFGDVSPLRTQKRSTTYKEGRTCQWFCELIRCVSGGVDIFHADSVPLDLFHEKMNAYEEVPNALVVA